MRHPGCTNTRAPRRLSRTAESALRSCHTANHPDRDRKSTRLNSSHLVISYAVFCLKKKKQELHSPPRQLPRGTFYEAIVPCYRTFAAASSDTTTRLRVPFSHAAAPGRRLRPWSLGT